MVETRRSSKAHLKDGVEQPTAQPPKTLRQRRSLAVVASEEPNDADFSAGEQVHTPHASEYGSGLIEEEEAEIKEPIQENKEPVASTPCGRPSYQWSWLPTPLKSVFLGSKASTLLTTFHVHEVRCPQLFSGKYSRTSPHFHSFAVPLHIVPSFQQVPEYIRQDFIHTRYRDPNLRKRDCLRSLFLPFHNEWGNVWVHVLGAIYFCYLFVDIFYRFTSAPAFNGHTHPPTTATASPSLLIKSFAPVDMFMFLLYLASAINCLVSSSVYHTFCSSGHGAFCTLLTTDWTGISVLIFCSLVPCVYYGFYDSFAWKMVYWLCGTVLAAATLYTTRSPRFSGNDYLGLRLSMFGASTLFGVFPLGHLIIREGIFSDPHITAFFLMMGCLYFCYIGGCTLFVLRVPERWAPPGTFDLIFQSHQLWHLAVVGGAISYFIGLKYLYTFRMVTHNQPMAWNHLFPYTTPFEVVP